MTPPFYNRVYRVPLTLDWHGWRRRPRLVRYRATFYSSAYGMGWASAWSEAECERRFNRMCGEFFAGDFA